MAVAPDSSLKNDLMIDVMTGSDLGLRFVGTQVAPRSSCAGTYREKSKVVLTRKPQFFRIVRNELCSNLNKSPPSYDPAVPAFSGSSMTSTCPSTYRASFAIGDEHAAKRVVDVLTEICSRARPRWPRSSGRTGAGTSPCILPTRRTRRWCANSSTNAAGDEIAAGSPSTPSRPRTGSRPASKTSCRCRPGASSCTARMTASACAPNKLGIEIEAALAFGTGHHGTTRGCLLLLDHVLKALAAAARARSRHRHRRAGDRGGQGAACGCSPATSIRRRCRSRARMRGSTRPAIWCR